MRRSIDLQPGNQDRATVCTLVNGMSGWKTALAGLSLFLIFHFLMHFIS
jgi:hypothetical protein